MRRQEVAGLTRCNDEAAVVEIGQVINGSETRPIHVSEGVARPGMWRGAAVDRMITTVGLDRKIGEPSTDGYPREYAMCEGRAMQITPAPFVHVRAQLSGNLIEGPLKSNLEKVPAGDRPDLSGPPFMRGSGAIATPEVVGCIRVF